LQLPEIKAQKTAELCCSTPDLRKLQADDNILIKEIIPFFLEKIDSPEQIFVI
jgi:hypothetical protein